MNDTERTVRRSYTSQRREQQAEQTHADILAAARTLFAAEGYGRVSMAEIAEAANVSVRTVYSSVGAKPQILAELTALIDQSGQVGPINELIAESRDPKEILQLAARLRRLLMEGAWDIVLLMADAATSDDEARQAYEHSQQSSLRGAERIVDRLIEIDTTLRLPRKTSIDSLYALMHWRLYIRLVGDRGWSPDQFQDWQAALLIAALIDS